MFSLGFLALVGTAAAGVVFPVPDPYRWDESFVVEMPQLDDEHRGLFNGIMMVEANNVDEELQKLTVKFEDHFALEESYFKQTMSDEYIADHLKKHATFMERYYAWKTPVPESEVVWAKNWLVQHIKNTDFQYVGNMPHHVPKPYFWDESFEVFYARLDEEHKILFDHIRELGNNPSSSQHLSDLKFKMRAHFDYERGFFCNSETYTDCDAHSKKHDTFYKRLYAMENPVDIAEIDWAKNWLAQHIKNTDFQYKFKLNNYLHEVPRPYVWQPYLQVYSHQIDDEHIGLFKAIRDSVEHPDDQAKLDFLYNLMVAHFEYEEGEFSKIPDFEEYIADHKNKHANFLAKLKAIEIPLDCDIINFVETWLVQHIANTDFAYRGKLVHNVPEPYAWNPEFTTFYEQIDDEHKGLFDCIEAVSQTPGDEAVVANCKTLLRMHFDYEESEFCKVPDYDCFGHYLKHYKFQMKFQDAAIPVPADVSAWAKDWLVQHIKNTDHAYKGKLYRRMFYPVPSPYVWDESFLVDYKRLDDEHVLLFDAVRDCEANNADQAVYEAMIKVFNDHFRYEESMFSTIMDNVHDIADHRNRHLGVMNTIVGARVPISQEILEFVKNWLVQHIKNTDFDYKGKMPVVHDVPNPYKWDNSFAVLYKQMDDEHKPLFSCLEDVGNKPDDAALLADCLASYEFHFANEQKLFTESATYPAEEAYQHINKHDSFIATMRGIRTPVDAEYVAYAKNWLAQHIKNTDFRYKGKMPYHVADPYVWDESFQTNYKRIDDEHVGLFDAMQALADDPTNIDLLNLNRDLYRDHFDYEEKQFMQCGEECDAGQHKKKHDVFFKTLTWVTVPVSIDYINFAKNWLAQHIKNTDFKYKYKLATHHDTPQPYIWNTEFAVNYKQMDDEHVGLFEAMDALQNDLGNQGIVDDLQEKMRDHFYAEEEKFCDSLDLPWDYCQQHKKKHVIFSARFERMQAPVDLDELLWAQDWLVQHIKNTDFGYKGHLKHEVPEPYVWDASFATDYSRIDSEHDVLFANILEVSQIPDSQTALDKLKENMKLHFDFEEGRFCEVQNFNCVDHKMKHYKFFVLLDDMTAPINCETINWAKNWLAQHIKNTDHQYKGRLNGPDSGDNFTGALP